MPDRRAPHPRRPRTRAGRRRTRLDRQAGGKENSDSRANESAAVSSATRAAREAYREDLGYQSAVAADGANGGLRSAGRTDALLTGPREGDAKTIALDYVRAHLDVFALDAQDLGTLELAARYRSGDGVTHLTWVQTVDGVPAYDSELYANVTEDGRIVNVGGSAVHALDPNRGTPGLSAGEALAAAKRDVDGSQIAPATTSTSGSARTTHFANGDSGHLVVFADPDGDRLAWELTVAGEAPYVYTEVVDATTGDVLARSGLTQFAAGDASVYFSHPGSSADATPHTVSLTADQNWLSLSANGTKLSGRNTHTYADIASNNSAQANEETPATGTGDYVYPLIGVAPASGRTCPTVFSTPCSWNGTTRSTATVNQNQNNVQIFYMVNTFHDWLAGEPNIGFTNASHNFEVGGTGGDDPVISEGSDISGTNNANMSTPADGSSPRMQMYLFATTPFTAANGGSGRRSTAATTPASSITSSHTGSRTGSSTTGSPTGSTPLRPAPWARRGATGTRWTTSSTRAM